MTKPIARTAEDFDEVFAASSWSANGYLSRGEKVFLRKGFELALEHINPAEDMKTLQEACADLIIKGRRQKALIDHLKGELTRLRNRA